MTSRPFALAALALAFTAQAQQPPSTAAAPASSRRHNARRRQPWTAALAVIRSGAPTSPMASFVAGLAGLAGSCWKSSRPDGRSDVQVLREAVQPLHPRLRSSSTRATRSRAGAGSADLAHAYDAETRASSSIRSGNGRATAAFGSGQATLVNAGELIFQNVHNAGQRGDCRLDPVCAVRSTRISFKRLAPATARPGRMDRSESASHPRTGAEAGFVALVWAAFFVYNPRLTIVSPLPV